MSMAARLWRLSCSLHRRQYRRSARLVKTLNFFLFHCLLPPEADLGRNVQLCHHGLGVVIHPNVSIGNNVRIFHNVTIAGTTWIDSPHRVRIDDDVLIGVGAVILPRTDQGLRIGRGAVVGAGAVVTHDVPPKATVVGVPARSITGEDESQTAKIKPASSASGPVQ